MSKGTGIQKKLLAIVLLPVTILGVLIMAFGMILLYRSYTENIKEELESTANILVDCLKLSVPGDYSYENDTLYKGDMNISRSPILYRIKLRSYIDTTIFWQDTRVLTTVSDLQGLSAVGTKASPEVTAAVLENGNEYYSTNLDIGGIKYIAYYMPLENSGHEIVGMVFAGKRKQSVRDNVVAILIWFLLFSAFAVFVATLIMSVFSKRMVKDINGINNFLATIAMGKLNVDLPEEITWRDDELGMIGQYASQMRNDLQKLIETDPLTTLFNRRSCNSKLKAMEEKDIGYSVVMCDIDWFKRINDNYGHDAGDYVLVQISNMIKDNIRDCGFASRWGGEEFLLIYQLDYEETKMKVEDLQSVIRQKEFIYGDQEIRVAMTFGVETSHPKEPYEERIKRADNKLYIGKNNGRDQIVF